MGKSEVEAHEKGRDFADFRYGCVGYSVYSDRKGQKDVQDGNSELPACIGIEVVISLVFNLLLEEYKWNFLFASFTTLISILVDGKSSGYIDFTGFIDKVYARTLQIYILAKIYVMCVIVCWSTLILIGGLSSRKKYHSACLDSWVSRDINPLMLSCVATGFSGQKSHSCWLCSCSCS